MDTKQPLLSGMLRKWTKSGPIKPLKKFQLQEPLSTGPKLAETLIPTACVGHQTVVHERTLRSGHS